MVNVSVVKLKNEITDIAKQFAGGITRKELHPILYKKKMVPPNRAGSRAVDNVGKRLSRLFVTGVLNKKPFTRKGCRVYIHPRFGGTPYTAPASVFPKQIAPTKPTSESIKVFNNISFSGKYAAALATASEHFRTAENEHNKGLRVLRDAGLIQ